MTKLETIRAACIAANPSIKNVVSGCKGIARIPESDDTKAQDLEATIIDVVEGGLLYIYTHSPLQKGAKSLSWHTATMFSDSFTPEGRPIRLADVLLTIDAVQMKNLYEKKIIPIPRKGIFGKICDGKWNFFKDDLTQQSEETIDFLYELLK